MGRNESAPADLYLIRSESLTHHGIGDVHPDAGIVHLGSEPRDHRTVVPAVLLVWDEHLGSAGMGHILYHIAETAVLRHAPSEEDLLLADVGHGALRDLREHCERRLLDGKSDVFQRYPLLVEGDSGCDHTGERYIHAFDGVRELVILRALLRQLLEDGAGVETHSEVPPELVEHVADADVLRLPEDPVTPFCEGYDLRVPAGCIKQCGIPATGEGAPDLDVRDAVVHSDYRDAPGACEGPCCCRSDPQTGPESGAHGE